MAMSFARRSLLLTLAVIASTCAIGDALAAEWPEKRRFVLVEPPSQLHLYPPPSSITEESDGSLLVLLYWPITVGSTGEVNRTRLVRIDPDGSQAFLPPFGELDPAGAFPEARIDAEEILLLPDKSILFSRWNAIDRRLPDGSIVRFAGTARYSETTSGDGGPATAADIGLTRGLTQFPDGSIVFGDGQRVRRVALDGIITTIAGTSEWEFGGDGGDGGPATAAQLNGTGDVLPTEDGGFLIAETYNGRVRRVSADGVITTVAGTDKSDIFESFGDGGPATAAGLALPQHLARLPDGTLLIGESQRIRQVAPDGTISTLFELPETHGNREGDFAGRHSDSIEAMEVTREGGIAVILGGLHLGATYLAPRSTRRTLVALRDARASQRRVEVTVDATRACRARLQILRRNRVVAHATRHIAAGRQTIAIDSRFAAAFHDIRVTLRADRGGRHRDTVRLFTSATLPERLVIPTLGSAIEACKRITARRIDCETHVEEDEEDGRNCLVTNSYRLFPSGILFRRPYGRSPPPPAPVRPHPHLDKHLERMALEMSPASPVAHLGRRHRRTSRRHSGYRQSGPSARWSGRTPRSDQPSQFSSGRPRG